MTNRPRRPPPYRDVDWTRVYEELLRLQQGRQAREQAMRDLETAYGRRQARDAERVWIGPGVPTAGYRVNRCQESSCGKRSLLFLPSHSFWFTSETVRRAHSISINRNTGPLPCVCSVLLSLEILEDTTAAQGDDVSGIVLCSLEKKQVRRTVTKCRLLLRAPLTQQIN